MKKKHETFNEHIARTTYTCLPACFLLYAP